MSDPVALLSDLVPIVQEAGRIAQGARGNLRRELKPDGSVVTRGDRIVEEFLRERLASLLPGSTVWGEEFGHAAEGQSGLWAVDPIDGTTNYAFGSMLWGVTVGLVRAGRATLGAIVLPDLDETYASAEGHGATLNAKPLPPIPPGKVAKPELVSYSETVLRGYPGVRWPGKWRCTGSFVVEAMFTATQRYRGMVGIREKLYDMAASYVVNAELGADIRYADGDSLRIGDLMADVKIDKPWLMFPRDSGFLLE